MKKILILTISIFLNTNILAMNSDDITINTTKMIEKKKYDCINKEKINDDYKICITNEEKNGNYKLITFKAITPYFEIFKVIKTKCYPEEKEKKCISFIETNKFEEIEILINKENIISYTIMPKRKNVYNNEFMIYAIYQNKEKDGE